MTFFKIISIALFVFSNLCYGEAVIWKFKKKYDEVSIYTSPQKTRLTIQSGKTEIDPSKFTKNLLKKIEAGKKEMLSMIGITTWKVEKETIKKSKGVVRIELSGFYINEKKKKTYFTEYHFYNSSKKLQLLLTNNKQKLLSEDAQLKHLKDFRADHGF